MILLIAKLRNYTYRLIIYLSCMHAVLLNCHSHTIILTIFWCDHDHIIAKLFVLCFDVDTLEQLKFWKYVINAIDCKHDHINLVPQLELSLPATAIKIIIKINCTNPNSFAIKI